MTTKDFTGRLATLFAPAIAAVLLTACGGGAGLDDFKLAVDTPATAQLEISTRSLPMGHADATYPSVQLVATGSANPLYWTLTDGTLPAGMALTHSGQLFGVPATTGLYPFTVRASDGSNEDTQALLLSIDMFGAAVTDGLHFGDAWSGAPVTLTTVGATGAVDFEIVNDETNGYLANDGTFIPGTSGGMNATVTIRATDRNTGATNDVELVVQPNPAGSHVARFGASDVWYLDFDLKHGIHPYATDMHACLAEFGLRASVGSLGSEADQVAEFLAHRAVLEALNGMFLRNEDGTAGVDGLGISFPMNRPDSQHVAPAPGGSLPGSATRYSVMSLYEATTRDGFLGAAVIDPSHNPNHINNSAGSGVGELGVFLNTVTPMIKSGYRLAERSLTQSPINDNDLPILHALLYGQDTSAFGARAEDIEFTLWAVGRSLAAIAAHEIAHSCGLHHNELTRPGAIMNYTTTIHPDAGHFFLPEHAAVLRNVLPGPGRYGQTQSKLGTTETLAAQAAFLGGGGLCCQQ